MHISGVPSPTGATGPAGPEGLTGRGANFDQWKCLAPDVTALPLETWSAAELKVSFAKIPHRRWLYGTYLIRDEITVLAAPGGAGKTALANGIAIEIATGRGKLGEKVWRSDDQKVLYVNGEDSSTEIQRRLWAFCQQHKLAEQDLVRLYVAGADNTCIQSLSFLRVNDKGATALNEAGFNVLETALQSLRPDLLIVDPLVVFCGGGNMNDNAVMSVVMRELKALAVKYECAILVVHHTRKGKTGADIIGEAEAISGAAAIVNLARRAIMPATMTEKEAKEYGVLPSQRLQYFRLLDAKSNLAPLSADARWYELVSEELPNAEPPIYENGDRVQAVKRAYLTRSKASSFSGPQQKTIRFEILKLVDRGLTIDGEKAPYSPNSTGNNKKRAILDDAIAAVEQAIPDREWLPRDLRVTVERELEALKHEGWVVVEKITKGRFRRLHGLQAVWDRTPWANERERLREHGGPTVRTEEEEQELNQSDLKKVLDELREPNGSNGQ
jgi:AAA domain